MRVFFLLSLLILAQFSFSQNRNVTVINGKKYYIHKVEKGQSLYGIAKIYNLDLNALIIENPEAIDGIKAGQELKIPAEKPKEQTQPTLKDYENYITHKVGKGETVYSICSKYKITEKDLLALNPDAKNGLKENSILKIKEKAKTVSSSTVVTVETKTITAVEEPKAVELINKPKKSSYIVGIFLPFHFDEVETLNTDELVMNHQDFPPSQQLAIDFYEGLQQAADSVKTSDFSVNFKLFDSGERDSLTLLKLTKTDEFKSLDMIIGPLYNSPFKIISGEAKKLQIPCVSPLTQQNKILFDNVFCSKIIPSNNTLLEVLSGFCRDSLSKQHLVLVNSGAAKDQAYIAAFKSAYNQNRKDTITEVRGIMGAKANYREDRLTYYVLASESESFISDFLTQLNIFSEKKENIRVIGLRKWMNYDNLDLEYFNKFSFTTIVPYFINPELAYYQKLNSVYVQKYNCNADDYYFLAADIGLYYFNLLKSMGSSFSVVLDDLPRKGNFTDFNFVHPDNGTGFENRGARVIRYSDYKLSKAN